MIRPTRSGLTDTTTGEIIDLAPLRNRPRKATTRRITRPKRKHDPIADSVWLVGLLGLLIGAIGVTG